MNYSGKSARGIGCAGARPAAAGACATFVFAAAMLNFAPSARADIVVDHPPSNYGGPGSDTAYYNAWHDPVWSQCADDFQIAAPATIRRVIWWGFYNSEINPEIEPPPANETLRIRFYDPRPGDGLPGAVLFEQSVLNPSRMETGRIVFTGAGPPEQIYQADLATPFALQANRPYWLEIVQLGDLQSTWRWEQSPGDGTPFAFRSATVPDWRRTTEPINLAFQLSTVPEPGCLAIVAVGFFLLRRRRERRHG